MALPTRVATAVGINGGISEIVFTPPEGIVAGDLLIAYFLTGAAAASFPNGSVELKGWRKLSSSTVNSRWFGAIARVYDPADPASTYSLELNAPSFARWISHAVRGHGIIDLADIVVGNLWRREDNGGTQSPVRALSITTPAEDYLVMAATGEASTTVGGWTPVSGDFTLWTENPEDPQGGRIEWLTSQYKEMPSAGATGDLVITYAPQISLNGVGIQFGIPGLGEAPEPDAIVNLFTVPQARGGGHPSWNAAGWGTGGAGTQGMSPGTGFGGAPSYEMTFTTAPTGGGGGVRAGDVNSNILPVEAGKTYTASIYFESNLNEPGLLARLAFYNASGTMVGTVVDGPTTTSPANTMARLSVTATAPAGAVRAVINARKNDLTGTTVGRRWRASAAMVTEGIFLHPYFDGTTPDDDDYQYDWLGAVNGSMSVRAAAGPPDVATGNIGSRFVPYFTHNALTVGVHKLRGGAIQVVLYAGATEVQRRVVSVNTTTNWGHAAFVGLNPNTTYTIRAFVGGVEQTDFLMNIATLPTPGVPESYVAVAGSCGFTASTHPSFDRMREENPVFIAHMGDLHYVDSYTDAGWRDGTERSLMAPAQRALYENVPMAYTWDNHDRIIVNEKGDPSLGLNLGQTDPRTLTQYRHLAGTVGWGSTDSNSRTWVAGRVRYIMTDQWTLRDDPDGDPEPRTFLGAAQKQWFKDTLENAQEPVIVWFCQWTARNNANGRWNSFPTESTELEAWINARPRVKAKMILIGGDSHSLQADDGSRTGSGYRFNGIPSLNMSGFNRSSDSGDGSTGWSIANEPMRQPGSTEAPWGGYSRITITDDGVDLNFQWEAVRVNQAGVTDVMAVFERTYGANPFTRMVVREGGQFVPVRAVIRQGGQFLPVTPSF